MIYIDNRIGSKELQPKIPKHIPTTLTHLDFGDAYFFGNGPNESMVSIGIERKTITDLLQSIITGRLSGHQLLGLLHTYDYVYLLVEGLWQTDLKTGLLVTYKGKKWIPVHLGTRQFTGKEIRNYLNTLTTICGIQCVTASKLSQSGRWISDTYGWWNKKFEKHKSHLAFHIPPLPKKQTKQYVTFESPPFLQRVIKEFSGVGWNKSLALSEKFGSLLEFITASEEELMEIKGIGKGLAKTILKEIGR